MFSKQFIRISTSLLAVLAISMIISCAVNPVTGKKEFMLLSEQGELALGQQSDPGITATYGLYQNDEIQAFIQKKGQEMAKISHRPGLDYQFKVLDSPVVNAFAVPGGYVYFTRGILAHFNNEAEFAGVLGHEIGHVTARHSAKQYSTSVLAQLGLGLGMVLSEDFAKYSNLAQYGVGLLFLKFGRDHESQSDKLGVEYSTKIGYDAHEMAGFFETLSRMRGQSEAGAIPTFMSTHPDPVDRQQKVGEMADQWQKKNNSSRLKVGRDSYLRMIDGLIYGEDPNQGYVENNNFYHPEMKFQFPTPIGWQVVNTPAQVQMAPKDGKAMMILTLSPEKTLDAAERAFVTKDSIRVTNSQNTRVNGLSAKEVSGDLQDLRLLSYFIQYEGLVYQFVGLSKQTDFARYRQVFLNSMQRFASLSDPTKLNVKPEVVRVKTVTRNGTLQDALRGFRVSSERMDEHSLINGMELNDPVQTGMLIKVIEKKSGR